MKKNYRRFHAGRPVLRTGALLMVVASVGCGTNHLSGNKADGSPGADVPSGPIINLGDANFSSDPGGETAGQCCLGPVPLTPLGPNVPCSFQLPDLPSSFNTDNLTIYIGDKVVQRLDVDGGRTYEVTGSAIVFAGALCDLVIANSTETIVRASCYCLSF